MLTELAYLLMFSRNSQRSMFRRLGTLSPVLAMLLAFDVCAMDIVVTRLTDIDFGRVASNAGRQQTSMPFCVNVQPRGPYQITAYGSGPGERYLLASDAHQIAYRLFFRDRARGAGRGAPLRPGRPMGGQRPARDGNCGGPPAQVTVLVPRRALAQANPGSYRGTLTLTVAPE